MKVFTGASFRRLCLPLLFAAMSVPALGVGIDTLGGDPIHTDVDMLSNTDVPQNQWFVRVSSFVYSSSSSSVPLGTPTPSASQLLFVYLLENTGLSANGNVAVNLFSVGNADHIPIGTAQMGPNNGAAIATPTGLNVGNKRYARSRFDNVANYSYQWETRSLPPPATTELNPGQWSIVFALANSPFWQNQNGTVASSGLFDTESMPAPALIPEPSVLAMMALGGLCFIRRRRIM